MSAAVEVDFPYLSSEKDRYDNVRLYVRRHGRRIRIRVQTGTPAFAKAYSQALEEIEEAIKSPETKRSRVALPGTLAWLGTLYFGSPEFKRLNPQSRITRRSILESCFKERRNPGADEVIGDCPLSALSVKIIQTLRNRKEALPGAANNRLKYLSSMMSWAVEAGHLKTNLAREVKPLRYASEGFRTWTEEDFRKFEARWPIGSKPRLALSLLAYTGVRRSDVVGLGRQHVRDGVFTFSPQKTRNRAIKSGGPVMVTIQLLPELEEAIAAAACGDLTFLVNDLGRPFTAAGFGNWFRDKCDKAGLPKCAAHGLRKAAASIAAENGATTEQLKAIFGWTTTHQASTYTAKADRRRLAEEASGLISPNYRQRKKTGTLES